MSRMKTKTQMMRMSANARPIAEVCESKVTEPLKIMKMMRPNPFDYQVSAIDSFPHALVATRSTLSFADATWHWKPSHSRTFCSHAVHLSPVFYYPLGSKSLNRHSLLDQ